MNLLDRVAIVLVLVSLWALPFIGGYLLTGYLQATP